MTNDIEARYRNADQAISSLFGRRFDVQDPPYPDPRIGVDKIISLLHGQPPVKEAVVVTRDDGSGDRRLVPYVPPAGLSAPAARRTESK